MGQQEPSSVAKAFDNISEETHSETIKVDITPELQAKINDYLKREKVIDNKDAIKYLIEQNDIPRLEFYLGKRLQFGTAGIRGHMGPGYNQMNDLVVIQTAQGIASYLLESDEKLAKKHGVIIGHDARHNSQRFARLIALAFLQKGILVYYNDYIIPTPFIAFGVKHYCCRAGIMVTASHNPKEDNGIKVYWHNGAQILAPHDKLIQEHILKNQDPWPRAWEHNLFQLSTLSTESQSSSGVTDSTISPNQPVRSPSPTHSPQAKNFSFPQEWLPLLRRIYGSLSKEYFKYIETFVSNQEQRNINNRALLTITYTPMHGVGHIFMTKALEIGGFEDIFPVDAQKRPNPDFTTVKFPNPEEAGALDLAFETARNTKSNLILANDPDSDRCAAALYQPSTRRRRIFNGNEIGSILGWWIWHNYKITLEQGQQTTNDDNAEDNNANDANILPQATTRIKSKPMPSDFKRCFMISTAVSSKFLQSMARLEGFTFIETLTGFKYMGNLVDHLENEGDNRVLFAYEEALGYMVDSTIIDKDGISACLQMAQCAAYCSSVYERTLEEQLDWLYSYYGYHYSLNSYYICTDQAKIKNIFAKLQANYPTQFDGGFQVKRVRDLNINYDSATSDNRASLPSSSSSYMVTFFVDDDITLTIRTSGTEPKIKYYSEIVASLKGATEKKVEQEEEELYATKEVARERLKTCIRAAIKRCLDPEMNDLEEAGSV